MMDLETLQMLYYDDLFMLWKQILQNCEEF